MLHLEGDVHTYHYLNQGDCSEAVTRDDSKQFTVTTVSPILLQQLCISTFKGESSEGCCLLSNNGTYDVTSR